MLRLVRSRQRNLTYDVVIRESVWVEDLAFLHGPALGPNLAPAV